MKQRGEITVFLSMCLLCVSALLCVMLESARTAGSKYYFQVAVNSGLDTLFSRYHRQLWEQYRIFALEYDSEEELTEKLSVSINQYLSVDNWYPAELESVEIEQLSGLADQEGEFLAKEVLSYIKLGVIKQFVIQPEQGEQLLKDVTEAVGAAAAAEEYSSQEKEVRRLEQAAENLMGNIQQQEQLNKEIEQALQEDDEKAFFSAAQKYRKTAESYSGLINSYEKAAKELADRQQKSREKMEIIKPDFQEGRGELFEQQWNPYDSYIEKDGQRYQEFISWQETTQQNLILLKEVEILVEEAINEEEHEKSLSTAAEFWREQYISRNVVTTAGSGDKEKRNLLEQVQRIVEGGLLALVLPEDMEISQEVVYTGQLPSTALEVGKEKLQKGEGDKTNDRIGSKEGNISGSESGKSFVERVLVNEYCGQFFPNALSQEKHRMQYELEYLLYGAATDRENLEKTIGELFAVRQGLNLIHILSDSQKREEAKALALVIAGGVGLTPLVEILACLIMGIWAMGEAVQDLRILMSGGKVPLWKQREDWNVSLEGLLDMGRNHLPDRDGQNNHDRGFSYESYLKLLLLKEEPEVKHMRMLDLMQLNIEQKQPGFLVQNCAYRVDITGKACGKHVFFAIPIVENLINKEKRYSLEARTQKAY